MVFFAISGLLMIETTYREFGRPQAWRVFLWKRINRIVPIYWVFTSVIFFGIVVAGHPVPIQETIASYLFIPYGDMRPLLGVGWTLNYEMYFYLLFALAVMVPRQLGLVVLFGLFTTALMLGTLSRPFTDTSDPRTAFEFWTAPIIILFPLGCALGLVRRVLVTNNALPSASVSPAFLSCLLVALGCYLVAVTADRDIYPLSFGHETLIWGTALCAVAICSLTKNPSNHAVNRFLILLGDASYSTYLSHTITIRYVRRLLGDAVYSYPVTAVVIFIVSSTVMGLAVHKLIENPLLRLLKPGSRPLRLVFATILPNKDLQK
jgi:peptidoglycan/LPS O-acetylase OafA/YrhL